MLPSSSFFLSRHAITATTTTTLATRSARVRAVVVGGGGVRRGGLLHKRGLADQLAPPPTPQTPRSSSNAGLAIMAVAVALPIGAVLYLDDVNPGWRRNLPVWLGGTPASSSSKTTPTRTKTEKPILPTIKPLPAPPPLLEDWAVIKNEVEELAQKLQDTTPTSMQFSVEEVNAVRRQVEAAQQHANEVAAATSATTVEESPPPQTETIQAETPPPPPSSSSESPQPSPIESTTNSSSDTIPSPPPPPSSPIVEEQPTTPNSPERESLSALRSSAQQVSARATEEARHQVEQSEALLRADLERVLAHDLSTLDEMGLRERLVQLVLELKDRNRWEAARLHEVMSKTTEELAKKYAHLMREQEAAYEAVIRAESTKSAMQAAQATEERLAQAVREHIEKQKEAYRADMLRLVDNARREEREQREREREQRELAINQVQNRVMEFENSLKDLETVKLKAIRRQNVTAAALHLVESLLLEGIPGTEVEKCASELRIASGGDKIIVSSLNTLPARAFAGGIDSLASLTTEFTVGVVPACREKALSSQHPGLLENAMARASNVFFTPSTSEAKSGTEAKLDKAASLLANKDLVGALAVVDSLPGEIKQTPETKIWLARAKDRIAVELCLRTIVAHVVEGDVGTE